MGWTMGKDETLATIWEIPDHLMGCMISSGDTWIWIRVQGTPGRKRADTRRMLDGIIFRIAQRLPVEP